MGQAAAVLIFLTVFAAFHTRCAAALSARTAWRERLRAQRHIRPHVNPLQRRFDHSHTSVSLDHVDFEEDLPVHIDIGCGKGHFCLDLAAERPDLNVVGIEIREPLVAEARRLVEGMGVPNVRFVSGSANALVAPYGRLLAERNMALVSASVQFPDPWPKRRHAKRRLVQSQLVEDLAQALDPSDGFVWLQSDVHALAEEMRDAFVCSGRFEPGGEAADDVRGGGGELLDAEGWTRDEARPFAVRTERERVAARRAMPTWRSMLRLRGGMLAWH